MSKTTTNKTIEDALFMYKETVSPSTSALINILNQIPEKEKVLVPIRRVTRSPYIWIAGVNMAIAFSLIIVLYPTFENITNTSNNPFDQIDSQVDQFEASIDNEDANLVASNYNL